MCCSIKQELQYFALSPQCLQPQWITKKKKPNLRKTKLFHNFCYLTTNLHSGPLQNKRIVKKALFHPKLSECH